MTPNADKVKKLLEEYWQHSVSFLQKSRQVASSLPAGADGKMEESFAALSEILKEIIGQIDGELTPTLKTCITAPKPKTRSSGQRLIPRLNRRLPVYYSIPGSPARVRGYSHDIGAMGLFILANRLEKAGQKLNIEIELPNLGPVKMQGVVVWSKWVPPALRAVEYTGFGVKITQAPEHWFSFFVDHTGS